MTFIAAQHHNRRLSTALDLRLFSRKTRRFNFLFSFRKQLRFGKINQFLIPNPRNHLNDLQRHTIIVYRINFDGIMRRKHRSRVKKFVCSHKMANN